MSVSETITAAELSSATGKALERLILTLADSKRVLGIRYSDWLLGDPSIETGIAASSMAQDEWGHARLLYAMLKDLGVDPTGIEHDRPTEAYTSVGVLDQAADDWASVVATVVLVDSALTTALEGFGHGCFELATTRIPKMLAEEEFHADFGSAWFRKLARGSDDARGALREAAFRILPDTLAWVAPKDAMHMALAAEKITDDADSLERRYRDRVRSSLALLDVDIDSVSANLDGWDEARGRGAGHPDEEAVVRARGDLNRSLLVE
jgi:ring-1,2-phenylacetyl-CoA epoxidase subunit PaaC